MTAGFISYTHADTVLKDQLLLHLAPLRREGLINVWHDAMLRPGEHLAPAVQAALAASDLVLLLVSADFIASAYCYEEEMLRAFARQREGTAQVVPIILRPCQWQGVPVGKGETLASYLALPKDGRPVTSWPDRDAAFNDAVGAIRNMLRSGRSSEPSGTAPRSSADHSAPPSAGTSKFQGNGASILGIRAKPTDLDRDRFLRAGYAATAQLFEQQLAQLKASEPRMETDFERVDSRSFAASVYMDGKRVGEVSIWHGSDHFRNALCVSYDAASGSRNSMNDWVPVEETEEGLAFKAGNPMSRSRTDDTMDAGAAADYLWQAFLSSVRSRLR